IKEKEAPLFRAEAALGRFAELLSDDAEGQQQLRMLGTFRYTVEGGKAMTAKVTGTEAYFALIGVFIRKAIAGGEEGQNQAQADKVIPQARLRIPENAGVHQRLRAR